MARFYGNSADSLFVLTSSGEVIYRDVFYSDHPGGTAARIIRESDGIAAVITRVSGDAPYTWGVTATDAWVVGRGDYYNLQVFYFPGARHGFVIIDEGVFPVHKVTRGASTYWVFSDRWPELPAAPESVPFDGDVFSIPNLA